MPRATDDGDVQVEALHRPRVYHSSSELAENAKRVDALLLDEVESDSGDFQ